MYHQSIRREMGGEVILDTPLYEAGPGTLQSIHTTHITQPLESRASLTADEILARVEVAKLGEATSTHQVDIRDVIAAGELTEEKRKEIMKAIVEKHMMESVKLESELRGNEIKEINGVIDEFEQKRNEMVKEAKRELETKLIEMKKRNASEEEIEDMIMEHAVKLNEMTKDLQKQKNRKMSETRRRLKEERMRRKRELFG